MLADSLRLAFTSSKFAPARSSDISIIAIPEMFASITRTCDVLLSERFAVQTPWFLSCFVLGGWVEGPRGIY